MAWRLEAVKKTSNTFCSPAFTSASIVPAPTCTSKSFYRADRPFWVGSSARSEPSPVACLCGDRTCRMRGPTSAPSSRARGHPCARSPAPCSQRHRPQSGRHASGAHGHHRPFLARGCSALSTLHGRAQPGHRRLPRRRHQRRAERSWCVVSPNSRVAWAWHGRIARPREKSPDHGSYQGE